MTASDARAPQAPVPGGEQVHAGEISWQASRALSAERTGPGMGPDAWRPPASRQPPARSGRLASTGGNDPFARPVSRGAASRHPVPPGSWARRRPGISR